MSTCYVMTQLSLYLVRNSYSDITKGYINL